ncbi:hypothetical protein [Kitasatospora sp. NPDC093806]|uniref:hypothetical protein n=1 Tax=Kitasatospora sp. NPDC093806 TaxID=3155075 RepID=UPI0034227C5E
MNATTATPAVATGLRTVKTLVTAYGALTAATLLTVAALAATGHEATGFMWGRSAGLLASAAAAHWLTGLAARGNRTGYQRMRLISVVMPIAIIALDLTAGHLPAWFLAAHVACACTIGSTAFVLHTTPLRTAFPKTR